MSCAAMLLMLHQLLRDMIVNLCLMLIRSSAQFASQGFFQCHKCLPQLGSMLS